MKSIRITLLLVLTAFLVYESEALIQRSGNWTSSTGTYSQEGSARVENDNGSEIVVECEGKGGCCWEIHSNGGLTIYDIVTPPPPPPNAAPPTAPRAAPTILTNQDVIAP